MGWTAIIVLVLLLGSLGWGGCVCYRNTSDEITITVESKERVADGTRMITAHRCVRRHKAEKH